MHYLGLTTIFAAILSFGLTLTAGPPPAKAGICNEVGLPKKCTTRRDIKKNAINSSRIKNGSIKGADIKDGAVGAAQLGLDNTTYIEDSGSPTDNCADLRDALTGLVGPAAVVLGPGTYDCGPNPVVLLPRCRGLSGKYVNALTPMMESFQDGSTAKASLLSSLSSRRNT